MWPDGSFGIEEWRIVEELQVLVVARHQSGCLCLLNLLLDDLLLGLAQSSDVTAVYPASVPALELGQQSHVLVIRGDVHLAQDTLLLLLLKGILHLEVRNIGRIVAGCRRTSSNLSKSAYLMQFCELKRVDK